MPVVGRKNGQKKKKWIIFLKSCVVIEFIIFWVFIILIMPGIADFITIDLGAFATKPAKVVSIFSKLLNTYSVFGVIATVIFFIIGNKFLKKKVPNDYSKIRLLIIAITLFLGILVALYLPIGPPFGVIEKGTTYVP